MPPLTADLPSSLLPLCRLWCAVCAAAIRAKIDAVNGDFVRHFNANDTAKLSEV